jgi:hypothetical protein
VERKNTSVVLDNLPISIAVNRRGAIFSVLKDCLARKISGNTTVDVPDTDFFRNIDNPSVSWWFIFLGVRQVSAYIRLIGNKSLVAPGFYTNNGLTVSWHDYHSTLFMIAAA